MDTLGDVTVNFRNLTIGGTFTIHGSHHLPEVRRQVGEWARRYGVMVNAELQGDVITVMLCDIPEGSPLRRRITKPYHGLPVGGSCFIPNSQVTKEKHLRVQVSMYGGKVNQYLSVSKQPGGFLITRKA